MNDTSICRTCGFSHPEKDCPRWLQRDHATPYDGQTDTDLEERFQDLYAQIMAGFDSLPAATWTPEYRAAMRDIQTREIEFRAIGTELARRLTERASRWNETMDAALKGIIREADGNE
jgi:hypothetical protein